MERASATSPRLRDCEHKLPHLPMPEDYEEGAALRALTEVQKSLPSRDDLEKTVESMSSML